MEIQSKTFLFETSMEWENPSPGVQRQIMGYNKDIMTVKVKFEEGAVGTPHAHPHSQTTYVASGIFEFTVGNVTNIVQPGDGVYMEPNVLHGCKCLEAGILVDTFSPMREDFIG